MPRFLFLGLVATELAHTATAILQHRVPATRRLPASRFNIFP
jgi:hypothetical protein